MVSTARISLTLQVLVLLYFFDKGICDSLCPNGIVNITGSTTGTLVYPSSGNYGINETKCWRIEVPKPYIGLGLYVHSFDVFGKGICNSLCPNGIVNITGSTNGTIAYPSSGNYGENETKCWRIEVPKPYVGLGIYIHSFDIEECKSCECDKLNFGNSYNSLSLSNPRCGRRSFRFREDDYIFRGNGLPNEMLSGRNIWFRFVSDHTIHYKGFNFSFIVRSNSPFVPAGAFVSILKVSEDETFEISTPKVGIKNYPAGFEWVWFLIAPEGRQVQLAFETFELEQSTNCENDYLEVREAVTVNPAFPTVSFAGVYGPILSKPVCGTNKPTTIQSTGNKMWVHFKSDSNISTTYKGFKASFRAGQGRLSIRHPMVPLFLSALLMTIL